MGRDLTKEELIQHKEDAIRCLDAYITSLIDSSNKKVQSKSDKLSYWIEDWTTFLGFESEFSPKSLRKYKRGQIIKAHLGYNVGSEEGGLHYCVVVDKENSINSPVVTIVPLTSVKKDMDVSHLHKGNVYLGNELFTNLSSKIASTKNGIIATTKTLRSTLETMKSNNGFECKDVYEQFMSDLEAAEKEQDLLERMKQEINKMKRGSIALVPQIRTISKIRIYDPKTKHDILSNVKLSNEKLDMIDAEIIQLYTGKK